MTFITFGNNSYTIVQLTLKYSQFKETIEEKSDIYEKHRGLLSSDVRVTSVKSMYGLKFN